MANQVINQPKHIYTQVPGNLTLADAGQFSQYVSYDTGHSTQDAVTASTTQTQAGGTKITAAITAVATANGSDAITFPQALPGRNLILVNHTGQTIQAFPFKGDKINAAAKDAAVTIADATTSFYTCTATLQWWGGATTNEA